MFPFCYDDFLTFPKPEVHVYCIWEIFGAGGGGGGAKFGKSFSISGGGGGGGGCKIWQCVSIIQIDHSYLQIDTLFTIASGSFLVTVSTI